MNKVYKGYELMEKAMKGEININQKVNSLSEDYKDCTLKFVLNDTAIHVMGLNFELIEDKTIDIDSIEEFELAGCNIKFNDTFISTESIVNDMMLDKINKLVQAVKHLNKEMQSIKK